jgi:hypothetical protein
MQKKDTEQCPRRARMPLRIDQAAAAIYFRLTHWEPLYSTLGPDLTDEIHCQEISHSLRCLSSLVFYKELDAEINEHLHNNPDECRHIVNEAMRLA